MMKLHKALPLFVLLSVLLLPAGGCSFFMLNEGGEDPDEEENPPPIEVPEQYSFEESLKWIEDYLSDYPSAADARFLVFLDENVTIPTGFSLPSPALPPPANRAPRPPREIFIRGRGGGRGFTGGDG
jgi:hypothetical protein